ncbi:hypothetical protein Tco_0168037 [Tanacetum coccineum]
MKHLIYYQHVKEEGATGVAHETLRDMVEIFHDHIVEIPVHRVQVIESIQRDQGHKIVATGQQSVVQSERISKLERDNTRLRGMLDVAKSRHVLRSTKAIVLRLLHHCSSIDP